MRRAETGTKSQYRRSWIHVYLERLASVFGIDCRNYDILSDHLHVGVRSRPDVEAICSDKQVALRWLQIVPGDLSADDGNVNNGDQICGSTTTGESTCGGQRIVYNRL